jgi:hypothetical protein
MCRISQKVQNVISRPSTQQFLSILRGNLLPNCPLTPNDITAAEDIFGPDIGSLKGKQVPLTPDVVHFNVPEMPAFIYERYKDVKVAVDIMYVNKIPFFVSISRDIHFCTSEMLS